MIFLQFSFLVFTLVYFYFYSGSLIPFFLSPSSPSDSWSPSWILTVVLSRFLSCVGTRTPKNSHCVSTFSTLDLFLNPQPMLSSRPSTISSNTCTTEPSAKTPRIFCSDSKQLCARCCFSSLHCNQGIVCKQRHRAKAFTNNCFTSMR